MKVIFLDIDGVLNTEEKRKSNEEYFDKPICEEHMCYLRFLVEETDAKIVLSSTWKENWNEGMQQVNSKIGYYLNKTFAKYGLEIYSKTIELPGNNRKAEIESWLDNYKNQVEEFVIIDDVDYGFDKRFFVMTNDEEGLNEKTVEEAIRILQGDYVEMQNVEKEWGVVREIIRDAVGEFTFDIWFKDVNVLGFFPESNMLMLSAHSFTRTIIEDREQFSDVLDKAIKAVFGENIEYDIEDKNTEDYNNILWDKNASVSNEITDGVERKKIIYDPFAVYKHPDIIMHKKKEIICKMLREQPERIFNKGNSVHSELLFRILLIFANAAELGITECIEISRRSNHIEIYSKDAVEFLTDKIEKEKNLFFYSDYDKYVIRNYDKKKKYIGAPFYLRNSIKTRDLDDVFFTNVDSYFTLFALVNLTKTVCISSIKDGCFTRVKYESGINYLKTTEKGVSTKKEGTYITYDAPDELSNDEICNTLERVAVLCFGLKFVFFDPEGTLIRYSYNNICDYLEEHTNEKCICSAKMKASGRDRYNGSYYNAKVELAFNFKKKDITETFYNFSLLPEYNVFSDKLYDELAKRVNRWLENKTSRRLSVSDIRRITSFVIVIKADDDCEECTSKRESPESRRMIDDMIDDMLDETFEYWVNENDGGIIKLILDIFDIRDRHFIENMFPNGMK